jgi:DNA-binding CsgD family transcriptional regulator
MGNTLAVEDLTGRIYDAGLEPALWPDTLARIADAAQCRSSVLYEHEPATRRTFNLGYHRVDPKFMRDYEASVGAIDPWNVGALGCPAGRVAPTYALISDNDLRRTDFYQHYLRPTEIFYGLGGVVERSGGRMAIFGVQHTLGEGRFSSEASALIGTLMPHMGRAYRMHSTIRDARGRSETLEQALHVLRQAVLVVEQDGRIVFANLAAQRLLAARDGIKIEAGRVAAMHRGDHAGLAALLHPLEAPKAGTTITLRRPRNRIPLVVQATPLRPNRRWDAAGRLVLVIEMEVPPSRSFEHLAQSFALTAAEARLWSGLAAGATLVELAERSAVSVNTLRVQLLGLFRKVGVHRQADLVRLALESGKSASEM